MSPPTSALYTVRDIPNAGRGILATASTPSNTLLLTSPRPAAHVIFRQYRKEVCAQCFAYDLGRTLPVRDSFTGKVFCSEACVNRWREGEGKDGVEAWQALETFVKTRSRAVTSTASQNGTGSKPGKEAVSATFEEAEEIASLQRSARCATAHASGPGIKAEREYRKALHHVWTQPVDPDILGYLLSGMLFHAHFREQWHSDVLALAMDEEPYKSNADLEAYCNSFLQLVAVVPKSLLPSCTIEVCQVLANAGSHNAFGIRAGSEDNEEYMGYALYPEASYFNHSCAPSISKKRDGRTWQFRTARQVSEGEELCISYLGGDEKDMTLAERRGRLAEVWGFECMCERCRREAGS